MERHEEGVTVEFVGNLDVNSTGEEACEVTAVSLGGTTSKLHVHETKVVHADKGERMLGGRDALSG
jgi:hypothetical protein